MLTSSWREGRNLGSSARLQGWAGFMIASRGPSLESGRERNAPRLALVCVTEQIAVFNFDLS
jgi:hypothetical protein